MMTTKIRLMVAVIISLQIVLFMMASISLQENSRMKKEELALLISKKESLMTQEKSLVAISAELNRTIAMEKEDIAILQGKIGAMNKTVTTLVPAAPAPSPAPPPPSPPPKKRVTRAS